MPSDPSRQSRIVCVFCPPCLAQPHETCRENTPEMDRPPLAVGMYEIRLTDGSWQYICPVCGYSEVQDESIAP